ncbi:TetR/AcrR family transcriptional regulator [Periweissella cryptocerci]|uniref:TetR/AcrR family transcriptional regulator n=1 Tax=Periweissella cryptocerci TaxID=2506420 RepID=A0A4P6YVL3_9LACO|nr:TetR/AcrR family transcriptional regulator [Periweissella cryptocerci]QBO36852.1 TetR/AcrR family transcriptional regulator [Periweissella cryptocerci]
MSNREEKKAAKRAEIFNVAVKLFAEHGYDNVTTAQIAAESHIAKKTLFQYFPSKEDIIFDDEDELINALLAGLDGATNIWAAFITFIQQANAANQTDNDNHTPEAMQLPTIIRENDALNGRLLKMWDKYERRLTDYLINLNYTNAVASALSNTMIHVFRATFLESADINEVITANQHVAKMILA